MRKLNLVCGMLLMFSAWGYGQEKQKVVDGYVINGVIEGEYKADKVDLVKINQHTLLLIVRQWRIIAILSRDRKSRSRKFILFRPEIRNVLARD